MGAASRVRVVTRWGAVAVMATAVLTATGGGFAQSYAGLYHWALEHGLSGWKAESFPLLVDLFIIVGELGLFLLALDAFVLRRRDMLSWLDFCLPLFIAMAGWTASLVFNVGHVVQRDFSYQATAAVPPIVSMLGLFVLLRTLHRYVQDQSDREAEREEAQARQNERLAISPTSLQRITLVPMRVVPQLQAGTPKTAPAAGSAGAAGAAGVAGTAGLNGGAHGVNGRGAFTGQGAAAATMTSQSTTETIDGIPVVDAGPGPDSALDPEALRKQIHGALDRHKGDVAAAHADVVAAGWRCGQDDVVRVRDHHWFPYAVYRLMARHAGDAELVAKAFADRGIDYDIATFDGLVRAWRA